MAVPSVSEMNRIAGLEESRLKKDPHFDYHRAFCRNIGLFTAEEQETLRNATVGFCGVGGMGGSYVQAMARSGLGHFVLADGDDFSVVNFNRQAGAAMSTVGRNKATALKQQVLDVNPEADVTIFPNLGESNMDSFLNGVDLVVNAIEAFAPNAYRLMFKKARERRIPVITGAPLAFGAAVVVFGPDPGDMSAEQYFDWHDSQTDFEKIANFLIGLAPRSLHLRDIDLNHVDLDKHIAPSNICGVMIGTGMALGQAFRYLFGWGDSRYAPHYMQYDGRRNQAVHGRLRWGNRGPWQRFRRMLILRKYNQCHTDRN